MCGKRTTTETDLCQDCRTSLLETHLYHWNRNHKTDIIIAVLVFLFTNACLIVVGGDDFFSVEAMTFRIVFLGIPLAVVMWKWYRLMHQSDPDYGELWPTYWASQMLVWIVFLVMIALTLIFVIVWLPFQ